MGDDLYLDWLWLGLQIIVLLAIVARELLRPRDRNLYAIIIPLTLLVLVQGQTWWTFNEFDRLNSGLILHMNQVVSLRAARLANVYVGFSTVAMGVTYTLLATARRSAPTGRGPQPLSPRAAMGVYLMTLAWTLVAGSLLLTAAGGLETSLLNPGQSTVGGLTLLLMFTGIGKLPLLYFLITERSLRLRDGLLLCLTLALFLLNSRFLAAFILLQVAVAYNYGLREISRKGFAAISVSLIVIFFVFGLYRDYTARYRADQFDGVAIQQFFETRTGDNSPIEWFYRLNIEGYIGLAGLLTYEEYKGKIDHDLGLSNLRFVTQFIPYSLRYDRALPFGDLHLWLGSLYPYTGSVVPSGMENAYAHFNWIGVVGLGIVLGWLTSRFDRLMRDPSTHRLLVCVLSVHALQLIRGSFFNALTFGLADMVVVAIFAALVAFCNRTNPAALGADVFGGGAGLLKSHRDSLSQWHNARSGQTSRRGRRPN